MELKEFIKTALADIVEGVRQANDDLHEEVILCYHTDSSYNGYPSVTYKSTMHEKQAPMTIVNFKVQIQAEDAHSVDGNAKASVLNVVGGGVSGEVSHTSATTQELSFSIPMVWRKKKQQ